VILCGDFNDVPNSFAYYHIGEDMQDAFRSKGSGLDRTYLGISPTLRIDYIFCDPGFDILAYDRINKQLSDHYPIMADLFLRPHSPE
jgi:endonuclease/exonuclease/phosphatase family metal-dependent hydrolase